MKARHPSDTRPIDTQLQDIIVGWAKDTAAPIDVLFRALDWALTGATATEERVMELRWRLGRVARGLLNAIDAAGADASRRWTGVDREVIGKVARWAGPDDQLRRVASELAIAVEGTAAADWKQIRPALDALKAAL